MKRAIAVLLLLIASAFAQTAQWQSAVTMDGEPHHHLALENKYVRVFKVEVPPHSQTLLHQHARDYVFVALGPSSLENDVQGKAPVALQLKDGEVRFAKGGFAHVAKNLSDQPFRNITVELLSPAGDVNFCDPSKSSCDIKYGSECVVGGVVRCAVSRVLAKSQNFEIGETIIPAGLSTPLHSHRGSHLAIPVTDLDLESQSPGKPAVPVRGKAGDFEWIKAGSTHILKNSGSSDARIITIEFKN